MRLRTLLAIVVLCLNASSTLAQTNLRSTFPGRRVGGGTRGECSARVLAHLVPANSVFAPGAARIVGLLEGPTANPRSLLLEFRPLKSGGSADSAQAAVSQRSLPAANAGVTVIELPPLQVATIWESSYRCDEGVAQSPDPLNFVASLTPPAVSLLVLDTTSADGPVQATLKSLASQCGMTVSRRQLAKAFGLDDLMAEGWPEQIPVRCP